MLKNILIKSVTIHPYGYNTVKNIEGMVNNEPQSKAMASIDSNFLYSEI